MEGLRTLEDIARFLNRHLQQADYKRYRHSLQQCTADWDRFAMLAARDAHADVGRYEKQMEELNRSRGLQSIAGAAAGRTEQGLRVLEEIAKYLSPASVQPLESLRYSIYDSNAQLQLDLHRDIKFLENSQLYVLVDCQLPVSEFAARVREMADSGVDLIQLRDKAAEAGELIEYAKTALDALADRATRLIINDRVDIARISGAWGVHIGQDDIAPAAARDLLLSNQVIGVSTHDASQVQKAFEDRADYIGCGPTFPSNTKDFQAFPGTNFLQSVSRQFRECGWSLPAFAIGGISLDNLPSVLDAGFWRVAVSSAIWKNPRPGHVAMEFRRLLDHSRRGRDS